MAPSAYLLVHVGTIKVESLDADPEVRRHVRRHRLRLGHDGATQLGRVLIETRKRRAFVSVRCVRLLCLKVYPTVPLCWWYLQRGVCVAEQGDLDVTRRGAHTGHVRQPTPTKPTTHTYTHTRKREKHKEHQENVSVHQGDTEKGTPSTSGYTFCLSWKSSAYLYTWLLSAKLPLRRSLMVRRDASTLRTQLCIGPGPSTALLPQPQRQYDHITLSVYRSHS